MKLTVKNAKFKGASVLQFTIEGLKDNALATDVISDYLSGNGFKPKSFEIKYSKAVTISFKGIDEAASQKARASVKESLAYYGKVLKAVELSAKIKRKAYKDIEKADENLTKLSKDTFGKNYKYTAKKLSDWANSYASS